MNKNNKIYPSKKICIFHCGDFKIFKFLINKFPEIRKMDLIISYFNVECKKKIKKINNLNIIKLFKVKNKGMDIGPFLLSIKFLLSNKQLYNKNTTFFKFHTKSITKNKSWTISLIKDIINCKIKNNKNPILIGSDTYVYSNNKQVNYNKEKNIFNRNIKNNNNSFDDYFNMYNYEFTSNNNLNKFTDLKFNSTFYKNYEPDIKRNKIKNKDLIKHWKKNGIKEYHRISNVNYIKRWANKKNFFLAGTMFGFNYCWLNIFKKYNLNYEYSILETGYIKNYSETNIHAWEYYFGTHTYLNNGLIKGYKNNKIKKKYKSEKNNFPIFSKINRPFSEAKIAFFLITPSSSSSSGGYRTLLNYIKYLNDNGYTVDLYFNKFLNYSKIKKIKNIYGIHCDKKIKRNSNLNKIIDNIKKYNVIDIDKNNYYIGFKCQRNYNILIANAWQTADSVYNNKKCADKIYYIIQDREELFYPSNPSLQKSVLNTLKPEFNYYFITKYLEKYFKQKYNFTNIFSSCMGVKLNYYYNLNYKRKNSVVIPYYNKIKPGRNPLLVENIINILSSNNITCYVYPQKYNKNNNKNIINLGIMTENQLNELYNKYKVGIIFSCSNPSRLGFEMYASGLQVIEYDSEFTKYDMPDKYFTKIKNENNILNIVKELFNKKYDGSFIENININDDYKNFLNALLPNL